MTFCTKTIFSYIELKKTRFQHYSGRYLFRRLIKNSFRRYLQQGQRYRVYARNTEFKLAIIKYPLYSINNSYEVVINDKHKLRIAPLELQIAYKLYLGSDKDIGDAVFLYTLFKQVLDYEELERWCRELNVDINLLGAE
jgi:hypothetical protein